jgi:hypothetical protein
VFSAVTLDRALSCEREMKITHPNGLSGTWLCRVGDDFSLDATSPLFPAARRPAPALAHPFLRNPRGRTPSAEKAEGAFCRPYIPTLQLFDGYIRHEGKTLPPSRNVHQLTRD